MIFETDRFGQPVAIDIAEDGEEVTTPYVQPLTERIETTRQGGDDLYINRKFLAIMEHEDNAPIVRATNMILAMSDPAAVVEDDEDEHDAGCDCSRDDDQEGAAA